MIRSGEAGARRTEGQRLVYLAMDDATTLPRQIAATTGIHDCQKDLEGCEERVS